MDWFVYLYHLQMVVAHGIGFTQYVKTHRYIPNSQGFFLGFPAFLHTLVIIPGTNQPTPQPPNPGTIGIGGANVQQQLMTPLRAVALLHRDGFLKALECDFHG